MNGMNTDEREKTASIIGAAFRVSNTLGCGFGEKVYENALVIELQLAGHRVDQQPSVEVIYRGRLVGTYQPDLIVDQTHILELKAVATLERIHRAQCLNYLRASGLHTGLVINFGQPRVDFHHVVA